MTKKYEVEWSESRRGIAIVEADSIEQAETLVYVFTPAQLEDSEQRYDFGATATLKEN